MLAASFLSCSPLYNVQRTGLEPSPPQTNVLKSGHMRVTWYQTVRSEKCIFGTVCFHSSVQCCLQLLKCCAPPICLDGVHVYSQRIYACFNEVTQQAPKGLCKAGPRRQFETRAAKEFIDAAILPSVDCISVVAVQVQCTYTVQVIALLWTSGECMHLNVRWKQFKPSTNGGLSRSRLAASSKSRVAQFTGSRRSPPAVFAIAWPT